MFKGNLLETYKYTIDNKSIRIQIFQINENENGISPRFCALANYKNILCKGNSIENIKRKCENEINIRMAIESGKIKIINSKKAEELARRAFKQFISKYTIPSGLEKRLGFGLTQEGKDWLFSIYLYSERKSMELTESYIDSLPDVLAVIKVDGETQETTVIENNDILNKVFNVMNFNSDS